LQRHRRDDRPVDLGDVQITAADGVGDDLARERPGPIGEPDGCRPRRGLGEQVDDRLDVGRGCGSDLERFDGDASDRSDGPV
jgi:hypothetical protein